MSRYLVNGHRNLTSLDSELRAEVSKLKASEKETKILDAAFDEGRFAFISDISRDGCRFRNSARRNAWERGWLESERPTSTWATGF